VSGWCRHGFSRQQPRHGLAPYGSTSSQRATPLLYAPAAQQRVCTACIGPITELPPFFASAIIRPPRKHLRGNVLRSISGPARDPPQKPPTESSCWLLLRCAELRRPTPQPMLEVVPIKPRTSPVGNLFFSSSSSLFSKQSTLQELVPILPLSLFSSFFIVLSRYRAVLSKSNTIIPHSIHSKLPVNFIP
jgi:hypothetical protein